MYQYPLQSMYPVYNYPTRKMLTLKWFDNTMLNNFQPKCIFYFTHLNSVLSPKMLTMQKRTDGINMNYKIEVIKSIRALWCNLTLTIHRANHLLPGFRLYPNNAYIQMKMT